MDTSTGDSSPSTPESVKATAQSIVPSSESSDVTTSEPCPGEGVNFVVGESITRAVQGRPYERVANQPIYRPLKIFALDPSVSRLEGATALINVPFEPLKSGPSGSIFVVADEADEQVDLDLEDSNILVRNGIDPSTSDKRFHNQMAYAVSSTVYTAFRTALGRHLTWGFKNTDGDRTQLKIRPRAFEGTNSFYDRESGELCFGFYKNKAEGGFPETVYACLSHDTVAHETTHALLDGLRTHFSRPTSADVPAFHEGFADIVAVFQHFSYEHVVRAAIRNSRGDLSRADLLTDIARQLGQTAREAKSALRTAIDDAKKNKKAKEAGSKETLRVYSPKLEAHDLGSVLVAAVFEAFITVFKRKTERLVRLATGGTGHLPPGALPADLQAALADKACKLASQFLTMCVRAIDYCPTVDITLGEYLRAVITADKDLVPDDPWAYREAWIDAFRRRHIYPNQVEDLSEDSLVWRGPLKRTPPVEIPPIKGLSFAELRFSGDPAWPVDAEELRRQACALGQIVTRPEYLNVFGLAAKDHPDLNGDEIDLPKIQSVRSSRRIGPSGQVVFDVVAEVTQRRLARIEGFEDPMNFFGGSTVIIDPDGNIRYVMAKRIINNDRVSEQKDFLLSPEGARYKDSLWSKDAAKPNLFAMLHDETSTKSKPAQHSVAPNMQKGQMMSLTQIEHIVVLMLENRSFDHMLGYLSHPQEGRLRADVDGLKGNESNVFTDNAGNQITVKSQRMASAIMNGDPCHDWGCVEEQLNNNNGGFVKNYFRKVSKPESIMHYFNAADVPVFDHLAREFTICDRWFCSLPGPTQPNRAYALAGTSDSRKENFSSKELLLGNGFLGKTIFEMLPANSWKIYSHDIAGLRFFKKFRTAFVKQIDKITEFFKDAAAGMLPNVSWIDPDFGIAVFPGPPNDDHPPHDSRHCQNLVATIYNALLASPTWSKTLFIVTYDEHGGFYDHVSPRTFTPADGDPAFAKYGVRVPAFVISPWAGREICYGSDSHGQSSDSVIFDHTSILRTILKRFATPAGGFVPSMTPRVDAAKDLDQLLTEKQPRTDCTAAPLIPNVPVALKDRFLLETDQSDLQRELQAMVVQATADGVPPDKL